MIRLLTLGTLDLRNSDGERLNSVLSQSKRLALLTYLAAETAREYHHRDTLIALFWPELDHQHARMNLRKVLHGLRSSLGENVLVGVGEEQVALNREAFWCDAEVFEEDVQSGEWAKALELYQGDFLSGFHLSGSLPFEEWLDGRREGLRRTATKAATKLAVEEEEAGGYAEALEWARRTLDLAPFDEASLRRVLGLFDRLGDRAEALRTHELFVSRMMAEVGVEPSPETQALVESIRSRRENRWDVSETVRPLERESRHGPPMRRKVGLWGGALASVFAAIAIVATTLRSPGVSAPFDQVVVARFENLTGDSTLTPLGAIAADWITQGLAQTGLAQVVTAPSVGFSQASVDEKAGGVGGIDRALALARETGAEIAVWGRYYLRGDSIEFQLRADNALDGTLLGSVGPVTGHRDDPMAAVDALRERAMGLLASRLDVRPDVWPFQELQHPPRYEAYLEFMAGLEQFRALSYYGTVDHLNRAVGIDSTLTAARFFLFVTHFHWSERAVADSIAREMEGSLGRLPPPMRSSFERYRAFLRGDLGAAYRAAKRAVELAPDDWNVVGLARSAMSLGRYQEAVDHYSSLDPDGGAVQAWPLLYWKPFQACLHFLGEHEREAELGREARRRFPGNASSHDLEIEALAAMGRLPEVQQRLNEGLRLTGYTGLSIRTAGYELWLHGHEEASRIILEQALAWYEARPASEKTTAGFNRNYGNTLYYARRWEESGFHWQALASQDPEAFSTRGRLGTLAARAGRREEALRISDELREMERPFSNGSNTMWRARIAALLGEREEAVRLMKQSISEGMGYEYLHRMEIDFEPLRGYPPYEEMIRPQG